MRMILVRLLLALAALLVTSGVAHAGCTLSSKTLNFADSSSYAVLGATVANVSGGAGLDCTGSALSLLGGTTATASMNSPTGWKLTGPGGVTIPYQLSADTGGTVVFTNTNTVDYMSPTLLTLLNIISPNGFSAPVTAKLIASPNVPAGTYADTVTVVWNYKICNGAQVAFVCVAYEEGSGSKTITVKIVVQADCRISAPDVNFNTAALASQFSAVNQAVLVNCTKDSAYKVAFSSGQNTSNARPWRLMKRVNGTETMQYNIYRSDGVTIWDDTNPLTSSQLGTGTTTASQVQSYVAKINPAQVTPPEGTYSDSVNVQITF